MQHLNTAEDFAASVAESGRYICPECTPERKNQKRHDLRITVEPGQTLYHCHHCGIEGMVKDKRPDYLATPKKKAEPKPVAHIPTPLNNSKQTINQFFADRGVDVENVDLNGMVITGKRFFHKYGAELEAVGFAYGLEGEQAQAVKWRPADTSKKAFTQDGAARMFYGLRALQENEKQIVIVEGEADVIALASVGIDAWSVPNGAPLKVSKSGMVDPEEDVKFSYVWDAWDALESAEKIVLACDADSQGEALKQELGRRIGLEKCWVAYFPDEMKDPNDVLEKMGSDALKNVISNAKPAPLKGVYDLDAYEDELDALYKDGYAEGESTGINAVDELFNMKEGMLYITTGHPGGGKSELIDEIMMNLSKRLGWKWAIASFENPPATHITKMLEKYTEKPFFEGRSQRMSHEEMREGKRFIRDHFVFLEQKDGSMATITDIIQRIKLSIARCGVRGAVIDPYNYINMDRYDNENTGISKMLSELSAFARANGVAIFFVAHPQKIWPRDDGSMPVPKGSHISGSAAWWAKADIGLTVHRPNETTSDVEVHVWKARFKWLGCVGMRVIGYNMINGKYFDKQQEIPGVKSDRSKWVRPSKTKLQTPNKHKDVPF